MATTCNESHSPSKLKCAVLIPTYITALLEWPNFLVPSKLYQGNQYENFSRTLHQLAEV